MSDQKPWWRAVLGLALLLLLAAWMALGPPWLTGGWSYGYGSVGTRDFIQYWAACRALRAGLNPYDGLVLHPIEEQAGQAPDTTIFMWNPPWTVLLMQPVLEPPFEISCLLWMGCNLALLGGIAWLVHRTLTVVDHPGEGGPPVVIALVAAFFFYPAMETIALGQSSLIPALGAAIFLRSVVANRLWGAGLGLVLLSIKPHLFLILGVWLAFWVVREWKWSVPAAVAASLGVLATACWLLWPGSLADWAMSFRQQPSGPGAHSTAEWVTSSLVSWIRLGLLQVTGRAPLWPVVVIPLLGVVVTFACLARTRPRINWVDQIHPVLCLSVGLAPYGWPFDHSVLVIGQVILAHRALMPSMPRPRRAQIVFGLATLLMVPIALEGPLAGHHLLVWYPWASLALWIWTRGGRVETRSAAAGLKDGSTDAQGECDPGAEQGGRIAEPDVQPPQR
jgi:hypothetical protein